MKIVHEMKAFLLDNIYKMYETLKEFPKLWQTRVTSASEGFAHQHRHLLEERRRSAEFLADRATMDKVDEQWRALHSYQGALKLNQTYLRGELPCNIGYCGPLDAETKDLVPGLLRLHQYGFLTHESQPFEPAKRQQKNENGGWWQEWRQRPYLSFLAPQQDRIAKTAVEKLTLLLLAHPSIVTIVAYGKGDRSYRTNIDDPHTTTEYRIALSADELTKEDFKVNASIPPGYHHVTEDWGDVDAVTSAQCLDITVASRSWDEDVDLAKLVEDLAIVAGIQRDFCEDLEPADDLVSMAAAYNALCDGSETERE